MKLKLLFLPLIGLLTLSSLTSCSNDTSNDKFTLTYGTYEESQATHLNYNDLIAKLDDKESFILATYESDNTSCACWQVLSASMNKIVKENHIRLYKIEHFQFEDEEKYDILSFQDRPALNFIKDGKVIDTIAYSTTNPNPIFKSKEALLECIAEKCYLPNYYFMPAISASETIDTHINNKETFIVGYYYASCADCKYAFPNVLFPFTNNQKFKIPMYLVNLEVEGLLINNGKKDKTNPNYQAYKDSHKLSKQGDETFGYNTGYVPTFHYYENGILTDASVYFNDTVSKINNEYKVTSSFYDEKRQSSLHYLSNVETTILSGLTLNSDEVFEYKTDTDTIYIWLQESAAKYHTPLLNAFLTKYAI